jgi:hypothetical protein
MFKRNLKNKKMNLPHLNSVYFVFKLIAKNQNITEENESQFIQLLLKQYVENNNIIEDKIIENAKKELNV